MKVMDHHFAESQPGHGDLRETEAHSRGSQDGESMRHKQSTKLIKEHEVETGQHCIDQEQPGDAETSRELRHHNGIGRKELDDHCVKEI